MRFRALQWGPAADTAKASAVAKRSAPLEGPHLQWRSKAARARPSRLGVGVRLRVRGLLNVLLVRNALLFHGGGGVDLLPRRRRRDHLREGEGEWEAVPFRSETELSPLGEA